MGNLIQLIRSTTQLWVVTRHQYGISTLVSQTSFGGDLTSGSVAKCQLLSQAKKFYISLTEVVSEIESVESIEQSIGIVMPE